MAQQMQVTCPPGMKEGDTVQISTPGGQMQVAIPAGVTAGKVFMVQVAAPPTQQAMARDLPPGVPPGCIYAPHDKYWGQQSQMISVALICCAGCIFPCLCPCDTREAYYLPDNSGHKYVKVDECTHCGMGKCASGTEWKFEAKKKGPNGTG